MVNIIIVIWKKHVFLSETNEAESHCLYIVTDKVNQLDDSIDIIRGQHSNGINSIDPKDIFNNNTKSPSWGNGKQ